MFPRPEYVHVQWMIQRSINLKQHISPHIWTTYPYVQLYNIFTIKGDIPLFTLNVKQIFFYIKGLVLTLNVKSFYIKG